MVNRVGLSRDLAILWRDSVTVSVGSYSRFHVDVEVTDSSGTYWRFAGMFGNPDLSQRKHPWDLMRRERDEKWTVAMWRGL